MKDPLKHFNVVLTLDLNTETCFTEPLTETFDMLQQNAVWAGTERAGIARVALRGYNLSNIETPRKSDRSLNFETLHWNKCLLDICDT